MAEIKFSQLTTAAQLTNDDIFALAQMQGGSLSSVKTSMIAVANYLNTQVQYTTAYNTQAKTTAGAINELKQLISLIPQFAIEVVEELPTEDISDTTIYLVPAEDPEVGNYYEEYIHVNNTWELVGTTAVDLSAYYTKLEVDGLLATKASVTEVALKENKSDMPTDVRTIIKDCKTPKSATITNGIAQFECIEENLVKGLKVTMNPIQDLSHGDPSPTNICPISGRTEASVKRTGKNLFDFSNTDTTNGYVENKWLNSNGNEMNYGNWNIGVYTRIFPNTQYTISGMTDSAQVSDGRGGYCFYDDSKTYISGGKYNSINQVISTPNNAKYIRVSFLSYSYSSEYPQLELGSTATAYEPYTAEIHTKEFGQTVYSGSLDLTAGKLSEDMAIVDLGTLNWTFDATNHRFKTADLTATAKGNQTGIWPNILCECYQTFIASDTSTTTLGITKFTSGQYVYVRVIDSNYSSLEDFVSAVSGKKLCYELATPTTISTSAEEITTVAGTNIISGTEPISECQYTELATVDDLRKIIGGQ